MKNKTLIINIIVFFTLLIFLELVLGDWLSKYNFGYHMRDKRLITYNINTEFNEKKYNFNYIRNFHGFRMNQDIDPAKIKYLFQGGSTADEMPLPFDTTIVGKLNIFLKNDEIDGKFINAALSGKSTAGYINDFKYWFPRLKNFNPKIIVFFSGHNDADIFQGYKDIDREFKLEIENMTYSRDFFKKVYDYLTNNSFILIKLKLIKDKYLDLNRQKVFYDLNKESLYKNFSYIDYNKSVKLFEDMKLDNIQRKTLLFYRKNLSVLKKYLDEWNIKPVFVTQVRFNGISTHRLYLINKETKEFCQRNNYKIVKLDEVYKPDYDDYFDDIHTTPKGSLKVAEIIYPTIKQMLSSFN